MMPLRPWLRSPLPAVLGLLLSLDAAAGKPKLATLDMAKAFEAYHLTITARAKVEEARRTLQQDPRRETIKLLDVELRDLKTHVQDPIFTEAQRKDYYRRYMMKNHERLSLKREHEKHLAEQLNLINKGMVDKTRELLRNVRAIVRKIAEEDGYDHVFEVSGKTSSQLPSLIYIRNATDLTDRVIEELNRNRPKEEVATNPGGSP
ncbi:MAG: OmpH family outer membrane protein [Roseibacillus sp.]|nr:OmpH family outer membrane protein [Roseibacillus sp.]